MPLQFDTSKPRVQYDIAYACFLLIGLSVMVIEISTLSHKREMYAFLIVIPLTMLSGVAFVVGAGFSLWLWRHAPLPILSVLALLIIVAFIAGDSDEFWESFETALLWYGIIAIIIPLWWFLFFRWRVDGAMASDRPRPLYRGAPRVHYDIAYACFLLYGLTAVLNAISAFVPIDHFAVLLPLSYLSWVALIVGVGFSIWLWRHVPLPILAALTVLFVLGGFFLGIDELMTMDPKQQAFWFKFITAVQWAYGITATVIPLWWFLILRRRADRTMGSKA